MMHAGCVFVAGIHPSRTWMSGSLESLRWNACVHRLDLSLHSHLKESIGNRARTHANSKGENPSTGKFLGEGSNPQHYIKYNSEPNTLPTSYSSPIEAYNWAVRLAGYTLPMTTWRQSQKYDWLAIYCQWQHEGSPRSMIGWLFIANDNMKAVPEVWLAGYLLPMTTWRQSQKYDWLAIYCQWQHEGSPRRVRDQPVCLGEAILNKSGHSATRVKEFNSSKVCNGYITATRVTESTVVRNIDQPLQTTHTYGNSSFPKHSFQRAASTLHKRREIP